MENERFWLLGTPFGFDLGASTDGIVEYLQVHVSN